MKVLYAIQGTGNGHLSRARDIIPILLSKNIELDILVSGIQADVDLPFNIKYKFCICRNNKLNKNNNKFESSKY